MKLRLYIAFLMVVNNILFTTALLNVGSKSLPLFYLNFFILFILNRKLDTLKANLNVFKKVVGICIFIFVLSVPRLITDQYIFFNYEIPQIIAYFILVLNGFIVYIFCKGLSKEDFNRLLKWILNFFIAIFIYGIYTHFAKIYGLPTFLDFLINSNSFSNSPSTGGWTKEARAYAVWSEPSFSILPLAISLIILIRLRFAFIQKAAFVFIILCYTYFTYSRIGYIGISSVFILYLVANRFRLFKYRLIYSVVAAVVFTEIVLISSIFSEDGSTLSRAESIVIGVKIFLENPFFGTGYNTYGLFNEALSELQFLETEKVIHNLPVTWLQQGGIVGLVFLYYIFVHKIKIGVKKRFDKTPYNIFVFTSLFIGCLSGNILYFSIFWAFYFLFLAEEEVFNDNNHQISLTNP